MMDAMAGTMDGRCWTSYRGGKRCRAGASVPIELEVQLVTYHSLPAT